MTGITALALLWLVIGLTLAGLLLRPLRLPEAVWAVGGAALVVVLGLLPIASAVDAVLKGGDVYLFLIGMMLLAEIARREGLFDWVAVRAVNAARGSSSRLFALIYGVGVAVTVFLSNDATAVVLTPAVFAVARRARVPALPLLFVCAFTANAASFVLPISNPANIVLYGDHTPPLLPWLACFALPSLLSVVVTFVCLRWTQRAALGLPCAENLGTQPLSRAGRVALAGLVLAALLLMTVSALDLRLGLPTALLGLVVTAMVLIGGRQPPWPVVKAISWSVLPLVAGLFVLVEALDRAGVVAVLARLLGGSASQSVDGTAALAGAAIGIGSNLVNNLPAGLLASSAIAAASPALPQKIVDALLIGVDLGPNLSITGSLATILWLQAIRREGEDVGFWQFLRVGAIVMLPALGLAIAARLMI